MPLKKNLSPTSKQPIENREQGRKFEITPPAHVSRERETDRALEVGLGVVDVVGVLEKDGGDAKAGLDLHDGEEGHVALADGLQALHGLGDLSFALVQIRQTPQSLRQCLHFSPPFLPSSTSISRVLPSQGGEKGK